MLVLTRRIGEVLHIGDDVTVTVLGIKTGNQISLGSRAPQDVAVTARNSSIRSPKDD
jgi:carbon storage regulator